MCKNSACRLKAKPQVNPNSNPDPHWGNMSGTDPHWSWPNHNAGSLFITVLGIRDILVQIRIRLRGSKPLTDGSGSNSRSDSFHQWLYLQSYKFGLFAIIVLKFYFESIIPVCSIPT